MAAFCLVIFCMQYVTSVNSTCLYNDCPDYNSMNYTSLSYICGYVNMDYSSIVGISSKYAACAYNEMGNTSSSDTSGSLTYICVYSCQVNCSCPPPPQPVSTSLLPDLIKFIVALNLVLLLTVVLPVIAANATILVALALESSIVKVIRLILANILIASLINALALAMYQIAWIVIAYVAPNPIPTICTTTAFSAISIFAWAARSVFMATFSIVVYIITKHGNATKKQPMVAVLVAVIVQWVIIFLATSPVFSSCIPSYTALPFGSGYFTLYLVFFFLVVPLVAVIFLLIVCCNKRGVTSNTAVDKTIFKFGFFLLVGSGLNIIGLFVPGLIVTPILIPIFFKSIRKRLLRWLCCCMTKKRKAKRNHNNNNNNNDNNGEGRMVTAAD